MSSTWVIHFSVFFNRLDFAKSKAGTGFKRVYAGIGRAFYCTLVGKRIVVLHGFIKKTGKTPAKEIKIARERLKELKP